MRKVGLKMILTINQTVANFAASFAVSESNILIYTGDSSPVSSAFANTLTDANGNLIYKTQYQLLTNLKNAIPFKWMWDEQLTEACTVLDAAGDTVAMFSHVHSRAEIGYFYYVQFKETDIKLYVVGKGINEYILVFLNDRQIGQVCKHGTVVNNLDQYKLYLLDEYKVFAALLSLFVIYFDSYHYANRMKAVTNKKEKSFLWTLGKVNKLYDPQWLPTHFPVDNDYINPPAIAVVGTNQPSKPTAKKKFAPIYLLPILLFAACIVVSAICINGYISVNRQPRYNFDSVNNTVTLTTAGDYQIYLISLPVSDDTFYASPESFTFIDSAGDKTQSVTPAGNFKYSSGGNTRYLVAKVHIDNTGAYTITSDNAIGKYTMDQGIETGIFVYLLVGILGGLFLFLGGLASLIIIITVSGAQRRPGHATTIYN